MQRLQAALRQWCRLFDNIREGKDRGKGKEEGKEKSAGKEEGEGRRHRRAGDKESTIVTLPPTTHYVLLRNSVMFLDPPLPQVRDVV